VCIPHVYPWQPGKTRAVREPVGVARADKAVSFSSLDAACPPAIAVAISQRQYWFRCVAGAPIADKATRVGLGPEGHSAQRVRSQRHAHRTLDSPAEVSAVNSLLAGNLQGISGIMSQTHLAPSIDTRVCPLDTTPDAVPARAAAPALRVRAHAILLGGLRAAPHVAAGHSKTIPAGIACRFRSTSNSAERWPAEVAAPPLRG
jgi:hypothetical protein